MISGKDEAKYIEYKDEEIDTQVNTEDEFIEVDPEN